MSIVGGAQQWACEIVTSCFDQEFLDQLRLLTNNEILLVPRRLKGITSGQNGRCYWNANICAQTWGGKVLYGWGIAPLSKSQDSGVNLYGHACWLTPEGKLVDPTYCHGVSHSVFVPYTDKLILNGRVTESMCDMCFPKSPIDLERCLLQVARDHAARFEHIGNHGYFSSSGVDHSRYLNKIVYYDALPGDLVEWLIEGMDDSIGNRIKLMLSPCIRQVSESTPRKLVHDPSLTFDKMKRRFAKERKPICSIYMGYDVTASFMGEDMVWDRGDFTIPSLGNKSLGSGKSICDIPPLEDLVQGHSLPTQKKRLSTLRLASERYNLSLKEVVMLSNPFLYPHPYLMSKAGWKPVPRIKSADLTFS